MKHGLLGFVLILGAAYGQDSLAALLSGRAAAGQRPNRRLLVREPRVFALETMTELEKRRVPSLPGVQVVGKSRLLRDRSLEDGQWETLPDGRRVWRIAIHSPDAHGLRLHFTEFAVGDGKVWVYETDGEEHEALGPYAGGGIFGDGDFWTGVIFSSTAVVEYETGGGNAASERIPFRIPEISHLYGSPISEGPAPDLLGLGENAQATFTGPSIFGGGRSPNEFLSCHVDSNCHPEWENVAHSVAAYAFQLRGAEGVCTGTLIENPGRKPLFLTANHCVSDGATARSVVAFWQFESTACGSRTVRNPADRRQVPQQEGARLLVNGRYDRGDFSLLELQGQPPQGARFSRLAKNEVRLGETVTGVHHPRGTWKRISFGVRQQDRQVNVLDSEGNLDGVAPADKFYYLSWTRGLTEGGSSGSGLFNQSQELVGVLSYGGGDCDRANSGYGRLSSFLTAIRSYVDNGPGPAPEPNPPAGSPRVLGLVNAASFDSAIAPGTLITIFGSNLASARAAAQRVPLPVTLGGVTVTVDGIPAPLMYVSPEQINAQLPAELRPGVSRMVIQAGSAQLSGDIRVSAVAPALFTSDGRRALAYAYQDWLVTYVTGQGALNVPLPSGMPAPANPLAIPMAPVTAVLSGVPVRVFSAMAPGLVGVLQTNIEIPAAIPNGYYELILSVGGAKSNAVLVLLNR